MDNKNLQTDNKYDAIIIGGGPAGVSAALYAARGGKKVLILHTNSSALHRAENIQNYFGTGEVSGAALYETGLDQARSVGATVIDAQATFVSASDGFTVSSTAGEFVSDKLVLAVGAARKSIAVDGLDTFEGRGVSYCAVCDAFFYRKKTVAVIGAGEFARHEYSALKNVVGKAYLLTNGEKACFETDNTIEKKIARIIGGERVSGVVLDDGSSIDVDGVFVAAGIAGAGAIAKSVGVFTDERGAIKTDDCRMTNVDGLYAVGDCTPGTKQIAKAVCDGMIAGMSILKN